MPDHPILDHLSRPGVRIALAAGLVVLGLGLGGLALAGRGSADAASANASRGPGLSIAVVPPPERDVLPGEVMDVGQLTNDFDGSVPKSQPDGIPYDYGVEQPAYVEADWDRDPPRSAWRDDPRLDRPSDRPSERDDRARPDDPRADGSRRDAYADNPRTFGFDAPRPDYRAEREARRAAMDARMAEARYQEDREGRRYRSSGLDDSPRPYSDERD